MSTCISDSAQFWSGTLFVGRRIFTVQAEGSEGAWDVEAQLHSFLTEELSASSFSRFNLWGRYPYAAP
jgi:hypothetical protein